MRTILKNRNLVLYFTGRFISNLGNSFLFFAQSLLIYFLTDSLTGVGILWLIRGISSVILIPFGGLFADRVNRKKIILFCDCISGIVSLCFLLVNSENFYWLLTILVFISQAINRLFDPAAKASFKDVSFPTPIEIAGSASAIIGQISMVLGPVLATAIYLLSDSLSLLFIIDGISFFVSFIFMLLVKFGIRINGDIIKKSFFKDLFTGYQYIFAHKKLGQIILTMVPIALSGKVFEVLILEVSESNWGFSNIGGIGIFLSIFSLGGILASTQVKKWSKHISNLSFYYLFTILTGVCFVIFSLSFNIFTSVLLTFTLGILLNLSVVMAQINIQKNVNEEVLGRVFSAWTFLAVIGGGIGAYASGILSDIYSVKFSLLLIGTTITLVSLTSYLVYLYQTKKQNINQEA